MTKRSMRYRREKLFQDKKHPMREQPGLLLDGDAASFLALLAVFLSSSLHHLNHPDFFPVCIRCLHVSLDLA